jgi:hypothetical protein
MKKHVLITAAITMVILTQGCALVYIEDSKPNEASTTREIGVLGGCIPLFSYQRERPNKAPAPSAITAEVAASTDSLY